MGEFKPDSASTTNMTENVDDWAVTVASIEQLEYNVGEDFYINKGYYDSVPELQAVVDKKAIFTVGAGWKADAKTTKIIKRWRGCGVDTSTTIFNNLCRVYTYGGDAMAEIIQNKRGEITNLKPIDAGSMKIVADNHGIIKWYEQSIQKTATSGSDGMPKKSMKKFKPNQILHLPWQRQSDAIHGTSTVTKLLEIIKARMEVMADQKVLFHRYVKPIWIFGVEFDDESEIATFKTKVDKAVNKAENLILPKDVMNSLQRMSVPQFSTLDPLPYVRLLQEYFLIAEGVPEVILGFGRETTEASSKILYLAFEQMVKFNQLFLEEQIEAQLGLKIKFNFPASLLQELQKDEKKDGKPKAPNGKGVKDE